MYPQNIKNTRLKKFCLKYRTLFFKRTSSGYIFVFLIAFSFLFPQHYWVYQFSVFFNSFFQDLFYWPCMFLTMLVAPPNQLSSFYKFKRRLLFQLWETGRLVLKLQSNDLISENKNNVSDTMDVSSCFHTNHSKTQKILYIRCTFLSRNKSNTSVSPSKCIRLSSSD